MTDTLKPETLAGAHVATVDATTDNSAVFLGIMPDTDETGKAASPEAEALIKYLAENHFSSIRMFVKGVPELNRKEKTVVKLPNGKTIGPGHKVAGTFVPHATARAKTYDASGELVDRLAPDGHPLDDLYIQALKMTVTAPAPRIVVPDSAGALAFA